MNDIAVVSWTSIINPVSWWRGTMNTWDLLTSTRAALSTWPEITDFLAAASYDKDKTAYQNIKQLFNTLGAYANVYTPIAEQAVTTVSHTYQVYPNAKLNVESAQGLLATALTISALPNINQYQNFDDACNDLNAITQKLNEISTHEHSETSANWNLFLMGASSLTGLDNLTTFIKQADKHLASIDGAKLTAAIDSVLNAYQKFVEAAREYEKKIGFIDGALVGNNATRLATLQELWARVRSTKGNLATTVPTPQTTPVVAVASPTSTTTTAKPKTAQFSMKEALMGLAENLVQITADIEKYSNLPNDPTHDTATQKIVREALQDLKKLQQAVGTIKANDWTFYPKLIPIAWQALSIGSKLLPYSSQIATGINKLNEFCNALPSLSSVMGGGPVTNNAPSMPNTASMVAQKTVTIVDENIDKLNQFYKTASPPDLSSASAAIASLLQVLNIGNASELGNFPELCDRLSTSMTDLNQLIATNDPVAKKEDTSALAKLNNIRKSYFSLGAKNLLGLQKNATTNLKLTDDQKADLVTLITNLNDVYAYILSKIDALEEQMQYEPGYLTQKIPGIVNVLATLSTIAQQQNILPNNLASYPYTAQRVAAAKARAPNTAKKDDSETNLKEGSVKTTLQDKSIAALKLDAVNEKLGFFAKTSKSRYDTVVKNKKYSWTKLTLGLEDVASAKTAQIRQEQLDTLVLTAQVITHHDQYAAGTKIALYQYALKQMQQQAHTQDSALEMLINEQQIAIRNLIKSSGIEVPAASGNALKNTLQRMIEKQQHIEQVNHMFADFAQTSQDQYQGICATQASQNISYDPKDNKHQGMLDTLNFAALAIQNADNHKYPVELKIMLYRTTLNEMQSQLDTQNFDSHDPLRQLIKTQNITLQTLIEEFQIDDTIYNEAYCKQIFNDILAESSPKSTVKMSPR